MIILRKIDESSGITGTPTEVFYADSGGNPVTTSDMIYDPATGDIQLGADNDPRIEIFGGSGGDIDIYGDDVDFHTSDDFRIFLGGFGTINDYLKFKVYGHDTNGSSIAFGSNNPALGLPEDYFEVLISGTSQLLVHGSGVKLEYSTVYVNEILNTVDADSISASSTDSQLVTAKLIYDHGTSISGLKNIVEDITPELGGDLYTAAYTISGTGDIYAVTYYGDGSNLTGITVSGTNPESLYYNTTDIRATAISNGISITDGTTSAELYINANVDLYLENQNYGGRVVLSGHKIDSSSALIFYADPDGIASIYHAGFLTFHTLSNGIEIDGSKLSINPSGFDLSEFYNNGHLTITQHEHGGNIFLIAENSSGTTKTLFAGDPDGAAELYYTGTKTLETAASGAIIGDGTDTCQLVFSSGAFVIDNDNDGGAILLKGDQTGGSGVTMLTADPDTYVRLYYSGLTSVETTADGMVVHTAGATHTWFAKSGSEILMHGLQNSDTLGLKGKTSGGSNVYMFKGDPDGAAELYYAGVKTLETDSGGINIYDSDASDYLELQHNGTHVILNNNTVGGLYFRTASENQIVGNPNSSLDLYYNNVLTAKTLPGGFQIYDDVASGSMNIAHSGINLYYTHAVEAGILYFRGNKTGTGLINVTTMDPDGATILTYAGSSALITVADGIRILDPGTTYDFRIRQSASDWNLLSYKPNGTNIRMSASNDAGVTTDMAEFNPDGPVELYYAGDKTFETTSTSGINVINEVTAVTYYGDGSNLTGITASGTDPESLYYNTTDIRATAISNGISITDGTAVAATIGFSSDDLYITNNDPDGLIVLTAEKSATGQSFVLIGDPDGPISLYYASTKAFSTTNGGVQIFDTAAGDWIGIYPDASTSIIRNSTQGSTIAIHVEATAGGENTAATFDPDGAAELYYAGAKTFETAAAGASFISSTDPTRKFVLREAGGGWSFVNELDEKGISFFVNHAGDEYMGINIEGGVPARVTLYRSGSISAVSIIGGLAFGSNGVTGEIYQSGNILVLDNQIHGGTIRAAAEDTGGNNKVLFDASPDGAAELYYAGVKSLETGVGKILVYDSDASDNLELAHNGSHAYLTNTTDSGQMFIEVTNVSSVKKVGLRIDATGTLEGYYQGAQAWLTTANGIIFYGPSVAATTIRSFAGYFQIYNAEHGAQIRLVAEDDEGANHNLFIGDPDGPVELYYAGDKTFETTSTSGINIINEVTAVTYYGDGSNLTGITVSGTTPESLYYNGTDIKITAVSDGISITDGTAVAATIGFNTDDLHIVNNDPAGSVVLQARNIAGDATENILVGGADGVGVKLYYNNLERIQTTSGGFTFKATGATTGGQFIYSGTTLYLDNNEQGGDFYLQLEKTGGGPVTAFHADPDGAAELYYTGTKILETTPTGISISDGTATGFSIFYSADDIVIQNTDPGGTLYFKTERSAGGVSTNMIMTPDNYIRLYHNNTEVFETMADGFHIMNNKLNVRNTGGVTYFTNQTASETITIRGINSDPASSTMQTFDPNGAVELYYDGTKVVETDTNGLVIGDGTNVTNFFHSAADLNIQNTVNSGNFSLLGKNSSGGTEQLFAGDPDAGSSMYYQGDLAFTTTAVGCEIKDPGGSRSASVYFSGDNFEIYNTKISGKVTIKGEDTGSVYTALASFDPDGAAELYYAGDKTLETTSTFGINITNEVTAVTYYGDGSNLTGISGGVNSFTELTDTFDSYTTDRMLYTTSSGVEDTADMTYDPDTGDIRMGADGSARVMVDAGESTTVIHGDDDTYITVSGAGPGFVDSGTLRMSLTDEGLALQYGARVNEVLNSFDGDTITSGSTDDQLTTAKLIYEHVNTVSGLSLQNIVEDTTPELGGDLYTGAFTISGTGDIYCDDLYTSGATINVGGGEIKSDGSNIELYYIGAKEAETVNGGLKATNSFVIASTTAVSGILDEDDMVSDSDTYLATQQSIKAYIDTVSGSINSDPYKYYVNADAADQGVSTQGSLKYYVDLVGGKNATLVFAHDPTVSGTTFTLTTSITSPNNIALEFEQGAQVAGNGTLTVSGSMETGLHQIFNFGTGSVVFGDGSVEEIFVEWWGSNTSPGITDMTSALQEAIDSLRDMVLNDEMAPPLVLLKGTYLVTSSLDVTFSTAPAGSFRGISIIGQGIRNTKILGTLGEAYPVIDYTGNTWGRLDDLWVDATSGSATACLLTASPAAASNAGNAVTIDRCFLQLGYGVAGAALVGYNCDLMRVTETEMRGGQGATWGFGKPAAVSSKFQTLHTSDSTKASFINCIFLGEIGPAFEYTGGASVTLTGCYAALVGTGTGKYIIKISSTSGASGNCLYLYDIRTENQSDAVDTVAIYFEASGIQGGHIDGALDADTVFEIAAEKEMNRYDINVSSANAAKPFFAGTGIVESCNIKTNTNVFGTIGAASNGNTFNSQMDYSLLVTNNERVLVEKDGIWYDNRNLRLLPPGRTSTFLRYNSSFGSQNINSAYTGGTGEQPLATVMNIPADLMTQPDGNAPLINIAFKFIGDTIAGNLNGRLRLELDDGTNVHEILDHSSIPAGAGSLNIDVTILNVSTDTMRVIVVSNIVDDIVTKYTNMSGSPISVTASMDLIIYVTNDVSNGVRPLQVMKSLV